MATVWRDNVHHTQVKCVVSGRGDSDRTWSNSWQVQVPGSAMVSVSSSGKGSALGITHGHYFPPYFNLLLNFFFLTICFAVARVQIAVHTECSVRYNKYSKHLKLCFFGLCKSPCITASVASFICWQARTTGPVSCEGAND